jgi:aspartate carbamoyltransferase
MHAINPAVLKTKPQALEADASKLWYAMKALAGRSLISLDDLDPAAVYGLLGLAEEMHAALLEKRLPRILEGSLMASIFFQPSTRTRFAHEAAMQRLGGSVITAASADQTRSRPKDGYVVESIADMSRTISELADLVVIRHPEQAGVTEFAHFAKVPVINAGNGMGPGAEHPTQALCDLYTIYRELRRLSGLRILVAGSLQYRVAHSLLTALGRFTDAKIYLLCPDEYWWTGAEDARARALGLDYERVHAIADVIHDIDVLYHNGMDETAFETLPEGIIVTPEVLARAKPHAIVMHPFSRDIEIPAAIDSTPHARYFQQVGNAVPMRMAILTALLGKTEAWLNQP